MIICKRCNIEKDFSEFRKDKRYKIGYTSWCYQCHKERNSSWAKENRNHLSKKSAIWRANNLEKARKINREFKERHKDKLRDSHASWAKKNKGKRNATMAKRKAAKLQATPSWADEEKIKNIYRQASIWQEITGQKLHVDHIIPLQGKTVCGLHCEQNLRIVEASYNESKRNKLIEDAYRQSDMFINVPTPANDMEQIDMLPEITNG